jgi:predicted nucleotidyltransferase
VAALLFGSTARGDDGPWSDVDLVVAMEGAPTLTERVRLRNRIAQKTGRRVDLFILADLLVEPELLDQVLTEARPIVDRAHVWPRLQGLGRKLPRGGARSPGRRLTLR